MNAVQCRMARAALQWSVIALAEAAKVAPGTVGRLEAGGSLHPRTIEAIKQAFEENGIEFTDGDAPGVKLHEKRKAKR